MKTSNNKCINKAECDNGIPLKATNQTDQKYLLVIIQNS